MSDDIQRALGRIEGKLDAILDTQRNHAERLDVLDAVKNKGYGILTAVTVAAGSIGALFSKGVSSLFHSPPH